MASKLKTFNIKSHVGGLNIYANATQVKDDESPDLLNTICIGLTGVTGRQGFIKLISTEAVAGHKIQGIFSYITNSVNEVLYVTNGVLYKYNGSGGSTEVTGGTFSATANVNACQVGSRLYFADGATALCYYDGTNIVTTGISAAPTKIKQVIKYNNRLYCNSDDQKSRVYYGKPMGSDGTATDTGDFTSGATAGYFDFGLGQEVVGFAKRESYLYVFNKNQIHQITPVVSSGTLDHTQTIISSSLGCRAPRSIENVENDVYFVDSTVYSLGEVANYSALRTTNVSAKIAKLFANMNQASIVDVATIYYDKEETILISVQVGSSCNDHIVAYQLGYKAWTYWDGIKANSFLDYVDSSDVKHPYFGCDQATSLVYELYQGLNDDGVAINKKYRTKLFDLDKFNIEKIFQSWNIQLGGVYGVTTVNLYVDGVLADTATFSSGTGAITSDGWGTETLGTFPMGLEGNFTEGSSTEASVSNDWRWHTLSTSPSGTNFQLEFINNNLDENFEIKQEVIGYLELPYYKRNTAKEV